MREHISSFLSVFFCRIEVRSLAVFAGGGEKEKWLSRRELGVLFGGDDDGGKRDGGESVSVIVARRRGFGGGLLRRSAAWD